MNIFNFLSELKEKSGLGSEFLPAYNIVSIGGRTVYIEGQKGLLELGTTRICCKLKGGTAVVEGSGLGIKEMTTSTLLISGQIQKIEVI